MPDLLAALTSGQRYCSITSPTETLPDGSVISLCAVLPMATFELLSFHNLNLSSNSWAAIADACSKTRALQRLVFKDCSFSTGQGLSMFSRALSAADLQSLEVMNSPLGDDFVAGLAEGSLLGNEKFTTLRLTGCGLGDAGVMRLAKAIEGVGMMCSLRLLDLSHNRIGDPGACALAAMLGSEASATSSSVPLNTLELEGNQLTDVGGLALCRASKAALMLQRLNLSLNPGITSATMMGLADAVRFNTGTLKEVAVAGCRASEDAAVALIRAANKNTTLQLLDIRGVPLAAEGVMQLCALLRYTTSLNTLRVDVATAEGAEAIARDLPANRSLMHITLGGPVPDGLLAAMSEILAANTVRRMHASPATSSPHIHAWIEESTHAYAARGLGQPGGAGVVPSANTYPYHAAAAAAPLVHASLSAINTGAIPGAHAGAQYPSIHPPQQPQPVSAAAAYGHQQQQVPQPHHQQQQQQQQQQAHGRSRSPSPGRDGPAPPEYTRSPRSEAGGSVYSHATHRTGRTHRTHRTNTSYVSFGGFTDMSRRTIMVGSTPLRVSASLAAGGAAEKAAIIFRNHDQNDDNHLNRQEMLAALQEMGVLNGIKAKHIGRFLDSEFRKADWDKDGRISLQDFISYYEKIAYYQAQMAREGRIKSMANLNKQMVPSGVEHNSHLKKVFKNYARLAIGQGRVYADGQPQMNSAQFHRLCQDAGFMEPEGRLSTTAVDVIFTRHRAANSRRMSFKDFIAALAACAYEMGFQFDDILEVLGANQAAAAAAAAAAGGKAGQPLTPTESARDSVSESSGVHYVHNPQQPQPGDPSFDVLGVPLATVHEGAEGKKKTKTKKAGSIRSGAGSAAGGSRAGGAAAAGGGGVRSSMNTNPLYDSQDFIAGAAGGPVHSSFNLHGALGANAAARGGGRVSPGTQSPGRNSSLGHAAGAAAQPAGVVQPSDLAVLEARVRLELEAAVRQMEDRVGALAPTASGERSGGVSSSGLPASADALLGAKLRQLEGQVTGVVSRQDELDKVSTQLASLQDILNKLAEEMVRIKHRADTAHSTAASAVSAATAAANAAGSGGSTAAAAAAVEERLGAVSAQLGGVQDSVSAVGRDVASLSGRLEGLGGQVAANRSSAQQQSAQLTQLQAQVAQLSSQVSAAVTTSSMEAAVAAAEKRLQDRMQRYDGALLQVAKQVDALDQRLREEQEGNIKTIEMLLAAAGGAPAAAPAGTGGASGGGAGASSGGGLSEVRSGGSNTLPAAR
ncbi:hypothetical protein HYH02_001784 [Chlamydomonas schloesseri]|uniref:EF-hand domain-containing protein n=1 Tax=Chlamydomonas schloesseri TaxID=2026947 RepID=A0A835WTQ9_9CHLO|nr:hypothetical protein HYH02_001784 [Chlamydomonas schloesseri]|eukprot:KAG2453565.1 hypothetical protein HYH02_001784 [Chlamydomonas schloesseri]